MSSGNRGGQHNQKEYLRQEKREAKEMKRQAKKEAKAGDEDQREHHNITDSVVASEQLET